MIVVAGTSALFAAFDADQPQHEAAIAVMQNETLAISPLVITELDHLVHRDLGFSAAMQVIDALTARMRRLSAFRGAGDAVLRLQDGSLKIVCVPMRCQVTCTSPSLTGLP
jgi:predicted nucleic acid-binding protein